MSTAQMGQLQKILVAGQWRDSDASESFQSANPALDEMLPERFPISSWSDCEAILNAACEAAEQLRALPPTKLAEFLESFAKHIEANAERLVSIDNLETALPIKPRLADVELPRTPDNCVKRLLRLEAVRGRCRLSTPRPIFDHATNRLGRFAFSVQIIFHSLSTAFLVAISLQRLRLATQ